MPLREERENVCENELSSVAPNAALKAAVTFVSCIIDVGSPAGPVPSPPIYWNLSIRRTYSAKRRSELACHS